MKKLRLVIWAIAAGVTSSAVTNKAPTICTMLTTTNAIRIDQIVITTDTGIP